MEKEKSQVIQKTADNIYSELNSIIKSTGIFEMYGKNEAGLDYEIFTSRMIHLRSNFFFREEDIINSIKGVLNVYFTREFALSFLKEEIKIPEIAPELITYFIKMYKIRFEENGGDKKLIFTPRMNTRFSLRKYGKFKEIVNLSMCNEIERVLFDRYFTQKSVSFIRVKKMVEKRLFSKIKKNRIKMDRDVNKYLGNMDWNAVFKYQDGGKG